MKTIGAIKSSAKNAKNAKADSKAGFSRPLWLSAFAGSAVLWAAFPPLDLWPLAWVGPIPWLLLIRRPALDGRRPYAVLALAGFGFWLAALYWLLLPHWATSFGWLALSFYFAFYLPVFVGLSRVAVHRLRLPMILAAPIVWTGLELARAHLLTGMSMANLGHTQYRWIGLIQVSDLTGDFGVGFVVMFAAAALAGAFYHMRQSTGHVPLLHRSSAGGNLLPGTACKQAVAHILPAVALIGAALIYGHLRMGMNSTRTGPRIALIQGSIDTEMRNDPGMRDRIFKEYDALSKQAVEQGRGEKGQDGKKQNVDLVVWPETMFTEPLYTFDANAARPADFEGDDAQFRKQLERIAQQYRDKNWSMAWLAQSLDAPLALGVDRVHFAADGMRIYNAAAYMARDGRLLGRYDKMHLVMFGEYVPLAQYFPWLQRMTPLPNSAVAGQRPEAFTLGDVRLASNICYESVLSHVIRGQVHQLAAEGREPDILLNLTNDGWFWGSSELDMHMICGVFRAVECRKPFLIAANTGFSAWIDSDGRIQQQGPRRAKAVLLAQPRLDRERRSWYLAHGDWFAGVCLAACGWFALAGLRGKFTSGTQRQTYGKN